MPVFLKPKTPVGLHQGAIPRILWSNGPHMAMPNMCAKFHPSTSNPWGGVDAPSLNPQKTPVAPRLGLLPRILWSNGLPTLMIDMCAKFQLPTPTPPGGVDATRISVTDRRSVSFGKFSPTRPIFSILRK